MALTVPIAIKRLPLVNQLFNKIEKSKKKKSKSSRPELDQLYRFLGVPEGAEFDVVKEAGEVLKEKYKDDRKMCIRIDNMVDKCFELGLANRMKGFSKASRQARLADLAEERRSNMAKATGPTVLDKILEKVNLGNIVGTLVIPEKAWVEKIAPWFAIPFFITLVAPVTGKSLIGIPFIGALLHIFYHGREWKSRAEQMEEQLMGQGPQIPPQEYLWPILYTIFWTFLGSVIGNFLQPRIEYMGWPYFDDTFARLLTIVTLFIGTCVSRPYRGELSS